MLVLHSSDNTQKLLLHMTEVLNKPLDNVCDAEIFMVSSQVMQTWLKQQLSRHYGIIANYKFYLFWDFFYEAANKLDQNLWHLPYKEDYLFWQLDELLQTSAKNKLLISKQYLDEKNTTEKLFEKKRFQLAKHMARLFESYQLQRPEIITSWVEKAKPHSEPELIARNLELQGELWQELTTYINKKHQGSLKTPINTTEYCLKLIELLNAKDKNSNKITAKLPQRISVFGFSNLFPIQLKLLQALSNHTEVHLYLMVSCCEYWGDSPMINNTNHTAPNSSSQTEHALQQELDLDNLDRQNPILGKLGHQTRQLQNLILNLLNFNYEFSSFEEPTTAKSRLKHLQQDILFDKITPYKQTNDNDHSLVISSCHTPLRELEVLKDNILSCLEQTPELQLKDFAIVSHCLENYSPYIEQVFADFDITVEGSYSSSSQKKFTAFIDFLKLFQERFELPEIMEFLSREVVASGLGISEIELEQIEDWLTNTNVKWGLSNKHKAKLNLPAIAQNTWLMSLYRLLLGYCMTDNSLPVANQENNESFNQDSYNPNFDYINSDNLSWQNIYGFCELEESNAELLGKLSFFIRLLLEGQESKADKSLVKKHTLSQWAEILTYYYRNLFACQNEDRSLEIINGLKELENWNGAFHSIAVISQWLEAKNSGLSWQDSTLTGKLTFFDINKLEKIPYKVIAVLGIDNFDSHAGQQSVNLIEQKPRMGDGLQIKQQLMLDALTLANHCCFLSYIGQDESNNSKLEPPQVIVDIQEYAQETMLFANSPIIQHHLLYNHNYYIKNINTENLPSYNLRAKKIAELYANKQPSLTEQESSPPQPIKNIESEQAESLEMYELISFAKNPQAYYVSKRLNIKQSATENHLEGIESFALKGLEKWQVHSNLFSAAVNEQVNPNEIYKTIEQMFANGELPVNAGSKAKYLACGKNYQALIELIKQELGCPANSKLESAATNFEKTNAQEQIIKTSKLTYTLSNNTNIFPYRCGKNLLKVVLGTLKPFDLVELWLCHLWNCLNNNFEKAVLVHYENRKIITLPPISQQEANSKLKILLEHFAKIYIEPPTYSFALYLAANIKVKGSQSETNFLKSFNKYADEAKFLLNKLNVDNEKLKQQSNTAEIAEFFDKFEVSTNE